jgi:ATP synthase protein I
MEPITNKNGPDLFSKQVDEKVKRKLNAIRENKRGVWFGLGMFGMVGWSVTVPAFLGTVLGRWLDKTHPVSFSWTLTFMIIGLFAGCLIAWRWIDKEGKDNRTNEEQRNE